MLLWWLMSSVCSNDTVQTIHLQQQKQSQTVTPKWMIITVINTQFVVKVNYNVNYDFTTPSKYTWCLQLLVKTTYKAKILPSLLSTSLYRWINFSFLFSVWAPIGWDKSLNVVGDDKSNIWRSQKKCWIVIYSLEECYSIVGTKKQKWINGNVKKKMERKQRN